MTAETVTIAGGGGGCDKVKVAIRVRPFSRREIELETKCVVEVKGDQTILHYVAPPSGIISGSGSPTPIVSTNISSSNNNNKSLQPPAPPTSTSPQQHPSLSSSSSSATTYRPPKVFTFDHCFWSFNHADPHYATQEDVFRELGHSVLDAAFEGYNACIFAYGQTGSGKSYTMMGSQHEKGLIPRLCDAIFERIGNAVEKDPNCSFKLEVSYMEIYNEKVRDLLDPAGSRHTLKVREHNILGPYVDGLSRLAVSSFEEINSLMAEGNKSRTVASTNMNSESSRSHAVFTLTLTCSLYDPGADVCGERVSKMSLVDLAGSERAVKTGAVGERLKEGSNINRSLTTLGLVISKLADQASGRNRREQFVPYRDSVLTWLLKDNLGGNSKTIMISTISPAADSYEETLSTLRYADRAKRIVNHAIINEDPNNRIIRELREEVEQLREQLLHATVNTELRERLAESEKLIREMEQTWEEKLRRTEKIHQERQLALEKMGISVQSSGIAVEPDRYYLVNLNADPSLNALLVYYLKERTLIGSAPEQDIQLSGVGIMPQHAIIEIDKKINQLCMEPIDEARTYVNGSRIFERIRLHNGDRILWGNNHFFRLHCPGTPNQQQQQQTLAMIDNSNQIFDYNYARDEMLTCNNPDLKAMFDEDEPNHHRKIINPDGSLSGSTTFLAGRNAAASVSMMNLSGLHDQRLYLEKLAQEREENFRIYLAKLREEIAKANTLAHEANLIAEEMRRNTEFKVTLQIPAGNLSPNRLKRGVFVSEPAILVKRKGFPSQIWSMEKFDTNLIEMRELYTEWKERHPPGSSSAVQRSDSTATEPATPTSPQIQLYNDPFYEFQERHLLIGVANIFLEVLMQDVQLDYQVPIISQQGEVVGRLHVEFGRIEGDFGERIADAGCQSDVETDETGSNDGSNYGSNQPTVIIESGTDKPKKLGSNQIRVRLNIKSARGLPMELSNFVFCQYSICGLSEMIVITPVDTFEHRSRAKQRLEPNDEPLIFNHQREFIINLTEEFRELCTDGALSIEVWGHRISATNNNNDSVSVSSSTGNTNESPEQISRTLADRWLELKRKLELWVEIHELNDQGTYTPVEVQPQPDVLTGGVYQLRQGQQRRISVRVGKVPNSGTLPFLCETIRYIQVGCVCVRSKIQKSLDSYQEGDLAELNERWTNILQKRQQYLQEQINDLMNREKKSQEDLEREQRLMNQWVGLVEERKASKCPAAGSEIPGAPDDGFREPPPGMEQHTPVVFLDLNTDELSNGPSRSVAGANSILPKEHNGTAFFNLSIVSCLSTMDHVQATAVWDSSVHESPHLNRVTSSNERIFLIIKVCVQLSHPARMDLILRKRIAINVYKKQGLVSSTKNIFKRISRADLLPMGTGIRYEIVSSIPKASEDIEDRESLALLAASDVDLTACDGESYIERYTKSVSALESILNLDRLRQEVAVREQIAKKAKRALQLSSTAVKRNENGELRKTLSVPNVAHGSNRTNNFRSNGNSSTSRRKPDDDDDNGRIVQDGGDSSYYHLSSIGGKLRQKASSLLGSMTGLNQLYVTEEIDIDSPVSGGGGSRNRLSKPNETIRGSTSPNHMKSSTLYRQSMMGTLMEEQITKPIQIEHSDDDDEDDECYIMFNVSSKSKPGSENDQLRMYTETPPYSSSSSGFDGGTNNAVSSGTRNHTSGTPISNESVSIPSSLSMPSSSNGSGDEDDEYHHSNNSLRKSKKLPENIPEWIQIGEPIRISPDSKLGTISYIGDTEFSPGTWIGVTLDTPTGKNDGSVNGVKYFQCKPRFGIFVRPDKIKLDPKGRRKIGNR